METRQLEHYLQLSFKYFFKIILNFIVIVKSIIDPDDTFWRNSEVLMG